jgi:hypothetical protein
VFVSANRKFHWEVGVTVLGLALILGKTEESHLSLELVVIVNLKMDP